MAKYRIKLTQEEVTELESIVNKGRHTSQTYRAAYVLLNCDEVIIQLANPPTPKYAAF